MSTEQTTSGQDALAKIRAGSVRMRPKLFFMLRALAAFCAAALILVLSSVIISFVLFSLRETGHEFLLGFGERGIAAFFLLFPWPLFVVDLALLFFLDWLVRGFSFGYRYSLVTLFGLLALASLLIALAINTTPLHRFLEGHADRGELPVAGSLYESARVPHHELGVFRGVISSIGTSSFVMAHDDHDVDIDDSSYTVYLPEGAPVPFSAGDHVFVLGDATGSTSVRALNISVFPSEE